MTSQFNTNTSFRIDTFFTGFRLNRSNKSCELFSNVSYEVNKKEGVHGVEQILRASTKASRNRALTELLLHISVTFNIRFTKAVIRKS